MGNDCFQKGQVKKIFKNSMKIAKV